MATSSSPLGYNKTPRCAFNLGGLNSRFFVADNLLVSGDTTTGDWEFICTADSIERSKVLREFVTVEEGLVNLNDICSVAGLGGAQQRDGSFAYYISEPISRNDAKGVGPFIMASLELERMSGD